MSDIISDTLDFLNRTDIPSGEYRFGTCTFNENGGKCAVFGCGIGKAKIKFSNNIPQTILMLFAALDTSLSIKHKFNSEDGFAQRARTICKKESPKGATCNIYKILRVLRNIVNHDINSLKISNTSISGNLSGEYIEITIDAFFLICTLVKIIIENRNRTHLSRLFNEAMHEKIINGILEFKNICGKLHTPNPSKISSNVARNCVIDPKSKIKGSFYEFEKYDDPHPYNYTIEYKGTLLCIPEELTTNNRVPLHDIEKWELDIHDFPQARSVIAFCISNSPDVYPATVKKWGTDFAV